MDEQTLTDEVVLVPNGGWDPRILVCRCAPTVDSFIVVTARYVIFVDTLLNPATAAALLDIARPLLKDGRAPLVIDTHADWDHCWGNQIFTGPDALLPAPIIAHEASVARYGADMAEQLRTNRADYPGRFDAVTPIAPTVTFTEQLTIDGGDLTLRLFSAPGHTDDHLAIEIPQIGTLLAGDAAEYPFPFASSAAGLVKLRATLRGLAALRPRVALYCHAPLFHDATLIERNIAYFNRLEEYCRRHLADHRSVDDNGHDAAHAAEFALEAAVGTDRPVASIDAMYRNGHLQHIAFMTRILSTMEP